MTHDHGSEYRVRTVHKEGTEELGGWMNRQEEVAQTIAGLRDASAEAYWLQVRDIHCPNCLSRDLTITEVRLTLRAAGNHRFPQQANRSRTSSAGAASE